MKRTHIIALVFVAVLIASLTVMLGKGFSRYENFESAYAKQGKEFTVVGYMNKEKGVTYKPQINPNQFSIYVKDDEGVEKLVVVNKAVPRDIEKSEKIVVTGKMNGDTFVANDILLKCPSKYKNREMEVNQGKSI
ncbi:MAG: cytochrome c maturation protein CcmE [Chitinophagales bacterium]|nr:cytochrome c maturation protein CcmE [Bacteroidota bacterium]